MAVVFRTITGARRPEAIVVANLIDPPLDVQEAELEFHYDDGVVYYSFPTRGQRDALAWTLQLDSIMKHRVLQEDTHSTFEDRVDWVQQVCRFMEKWGEVGVPSHLQAAMNDLPEGVEDVLDQMAAL
jgi:hypothetical protein